MNMQAMAKDPFILVKNDGRRITFKGLLSGDTLLTFERNLIVEDGDTAERTLPNGNTEVFRVLDTGFNQGLGGKIMAHFQMKVKKVGTPIPSIHASAGSVTNIYNVHGPNARVNLQSVDSSSNIANVGETELFEKMKAAIQVGVMGPQRNQMLEAVTELERATGSSSFPDGFQKLLSVSANAMTVLGPFLPALGQLAAAAFGAS